MEILECSSKGDKRFSAFYAKIKIYGKYDSIENHYQLCKRFGDFIPHTWRDSKGKTPTHININNYDYDIKYLSMFYDLLWCSYLHQHKELIEYASKFDDFHDMFKGKNTINCQADSIRKYIKNGREKTLVECEELIDLLTTNNH